MCVRVFVCLQQVARAVTVTKEGQPAARKKHNSAARLVTHRGGVHSGGGRCHSCGHDGTRFSRSGPAARNRSALPPWGGINQLFLKYAE